MKKSRRDFMKIAGISVAGLAGLMTGCSGDAPGSEYRHAEKSLTGKRWGMVIDTRRFKTEADFSKVISACHRAHNVPHIDSDQNVKWIWQDTYAHAFPDQAIKKNSEEAEKRGYLLLCNHCDNPPCVRVCPTGATFKREDGIVVMDYHRCIGCRFCMAGCPYGARSFNFHNPEKFLTEINPSFPRRMIGVVEKCTFCSERLSKGQMPYCEEASEGAIIFGDMADPNSEVSKAIKANFTIIRKPDAGTRPSVYYIV